MWPARCSKQRRYESPVLFSVLLHTTISNCTIYKRYEIINWIMLSLSQFEIYQRKILFVHNA